MIRVGSLFTGCGGIELGLKLAGVNFEVPWWAEIDEDLSQIRLPGTDYDANLGDVKLVNWGDQEPVDLITAGFPCQPVSSAGGKRGDADPRWLWPEVYRALYVQQPDQLLMENVPNLIYFERGRLWDEITKRLQELGYGVRWLTLGACHVDAAHHRHRLFLLATKDQEGVVRIPTKFCAVQGRWDVFPTPTVSAPNGDLTGSLEHIGQLRPYYFNRYDRAIHIQVKRYGVPPPISEIGPRGLPRLSALFAEWLMCLPEGHVIRWLPRTKALQVIGNAVCPPQLAEAWRLLNE